MKAKRTTITISQELYDRALLIMRQRAIDDFSGFIQILIREEWERMHPHRMTKEEAVAWLAGRELPTRTMEDPVKAAADEILEEETEKLLKGRRGRKPKHES